MTHISLLFPKDIYIEINGIKLASIKSYHVYIDKNANNNFFNKEYINIKLSKVCLLEEDNFCDFLKLSDFNLVIFKPKSQLIFSGCNWKSICETAEIEKPVIKSLSIIAQKKII